MRGTRAHSKDGRVWLTGIEIYSCTREKKKKKKKKKAQKAKQQTIKKRK